MRWRAATTILLLLLIASIAAAQRGQGGLGGRGGGRGGRGGGNGSFGRPLRFATLDDFDGSFQFCRVVFNASPYGDGGSWNVDFPRADENLSIRLSELTKTSVGIDRDDDLPKHLLVNLRDSVFFHCPFIMMTEVGRLFLNEEEVVNLRTYLLKGGFLWADDFWGERAWDNFEEEIRKALPANQYPIVDLSLDHPMFHGLMSVRRIPQIPSINFWGGPGGPTSENGMDSATPHARAILDDHGRVMMFITHNTDFGDAFEREGDNRAYFLEFSVEGYGLAVNVLLYMMTH